MPDQPYTTVGVVAGVAIVALVLVALYYLIGDGTWR